MNNEEDELAALQRQIEEADRLALQAQSAPAHFMHAPPQLGMPPAMQQLS